MNSPRRRRGRLARESWVALPVGDGINVQLCSCSGTQAERSSRCRLVGVWPHLRQFTSQLRHPKILSQENIKAHCGARVTVTCVSRPANPCRWVSRFLALPTRKSSRPPTRPGSIRRPLLIEQEAQADPPPIVTVVAPSGFGKTTLLSQWAEHDGRAFAWVSVEEADNDPKVLLSHIAQALDAVAPIGLRVFDALSSPGNSIAGSVVPRLGSALLSMTSPVALVLDDVHVLRNSECRAALSVLADHVPHGSLAGAFRPGRATAADRPAAS